MQENTLLNMIKGMCVGASMLVPGVSGGSMAMILGIYDKLIKSVSSFMKNKKKNLLFLGIFSVGAIIGMILFARPLSYLTEKYNMKMMYFFIGAVVGAVPMIYRKAEIKKFDISVIIYPIIGMLFIVILSFLPKDLVSISENDKILNIIMLVLVGMVAAIALVLPGISVSYMLLLLGMYDTTIKAIHNFYLLYLVPLGIGTIIGILLTTKLLEKALNNYAKGTYLIILGFILASVIEIFPGIPSGIDILYSLILFLVGFIIINRLSRNE